MERKHKITIPEPCHENWDKMIPNENGRFCLSCSKTVIDFTIMLPEEVQHFFMQNQNQNICGRFKKSQLDTITIQIPSRILFTQSHYHKMFLLALFIAMGTTLFSCADKNGNKQKIDKIEVVEHDNSKEQTTIEKVVSRNNNSTKNVSSPKIVSAKLVKPIPTNCTEITSDSNESLSKRSDKDIVARDSIVENEIYYTGAVVETKPSYPNGIDNFYQLFINEFKRPEETENLKNRIIVSFVIEKDGSLSSFDFSGNTDPEIKTEITRVLKILPNWVPGIQNGKKTRTKYSMPVAF